MRLTLCKAVGLVLLALVGSASGSGIVRAPALRATIKVGGFPNALAVGAGAVWVIGGDRQGGFVARIDPQTNRVTARIRAPVGSERACGVAVGAGSVWVSAYYGRGPGHLLRIDAHTNRPVGKPIEVPGSTCVAFGARAAWVTSAERRTLTRIDPRTGHRLGRPISAGSYSEGVAVGLGSVWVASGQLPCGGPERPCTPSIDQSGTLVRVDPRTNRVTARMRIPHSPSYVAVGPQGVWLSSNDGSVVRVDPRTSRVTARVRATGGGRTTLAFGLGRVWVTVIQAPGGRGSVVPVNPRTGAVGKAIAVGESPIGMAVGFGALWVANFNDGTVSRVGP